MKPPVYLNGKIVSYEKAKVGVEDRSFQFADGIYEVVEIIKGVPFTLQPHFERLEMGAKELNITVPGGIKKLQKDAIKYIKEIYPEKAERAALYIQISRGKAPRFHSFPDKISANRVMLLRKLEWPPETCHTQGVSTITTQDDRWSRCYIKSVALLPNVLAKTKAVRKGSFEAIFVRDGFVMEGSSTNLFAFRNGEFITSPSSNYILNGVTRREVIKVLSKEGIPFSEESFHIDELYQSDEVFLTGTGIDIVPVTSIDGKTIGDGSPGLKTRELMKLFEEHKLLSLKKTNPI